MISSEEFEDVLDAATQVGRELAPLAADIDARRGDIHEMYRLLRDAGFLALLVPKSAGGAGLGFEQYWRVLSVLGFHNGAAALGLNMHNAVIGALCEWADTSLPPMAAGFRSWLLQEIVFGHKMFASAASEPGRGARLRGLRTTYRPVGDGFVINGEKSFVSLAGVADYYSVPARPEGSDDDGRVSHFLVARDDLGVFFGEIHDLTAMYGTCTASMSLDEVTVSCSRLFLGIEGMSLPRMIREPHWMVAGYTGAYLGIAEAVYQCAVDHVAASPKRADSPVLQRNLGWMSARLHAARAMLLEGGRAVDRNRGSIDTNAKVHAAKYAVGDLAHVLAREIVSICGSAAVSRTKPLERLLRELQYGAIMPAKPEECLEYLGKAALGVELLDEHAFAW